MSEIIELIRLWLIEYYSEATDAPTQAPNVFAEGRIVNVGSNHEARYTAGILESNDHIFMTLDNEDGATTFINGLEYVLH